MRRAAAQMAADPHRRAVAFALIDLLVQVAEGDADAASLAEAGFWSDDGVAHAVGGCVESLLRAVTKIAPAVPAPSACEGDEDDTVEAWLGEWLHTVAARVEVEGGHVGG